MEYQGITVTAATIAAFGLVNALPTDPCFDTFDNFDECWGAKQEEFCQTDVSRVPYMKGLL